MCGIIGQVRFDGVEVDAGTLASMCAAMEHRGPDSRGIHHDAGIGLGIQRLRVIDLVTGDQPLYNEDRSVAVVMNGEIYNFRELRERLERSGHRFATRTDTEVIVHLYEERGAAFVEELHGMFAIALWDSRERRLLLARDRVGKKPLFYAHRDGVLSFGSELNAIMQDREIPRDVDPRAVDAYLALRYVPAPMSIYRAVRKLPPAHVMTVDAGGISLRRYWALDYATKRQFSSRAELHEALLDGIRRATRKRMISDVPLGAFLSGGIDSSAIVAAMAEASSQPVKTFSIGFETSQARFDELPHARRIAQQFGTEHHEEVIRPDGAGLIPRIVRAYGEPFADPSAIPTFYLAEMARRHVTVALNGDGGDENFAGYPRYAANNVLARLDAVPRPLRRLGGTLSRRLPSSGRIDSPVSRVRRLGQVAALDAGERYLGYCTYLDGLDRSALYAPDFARSIGRSEVDDIVLGAWNRSTADNVIDRMLDVDVQVYLPGDLLAKVDIATMAYSLEGRSPLLDHEFMEFAAALPGELKLAGTSKKAVLRDALRTWLPAEILDRPKQGFELPVADWFRGDLRGFARDVLLDPVARERGMFRTDHVERLLDEHAAHVQDHSGRIWTLLMLELWQQEHADGPPVLSRSGAEHQVTA